MRDLALLVNPTSGGGAAPGAVVPVARLLRDAGATVEVTYSPGPHATADLVAAAAARGATVVCVGGDGMLASVVGPVVSAGATLGIVPAGRGNDFARMLGLPADPAGQAEVLLSGTARAVDVLALDDRLVAGSVYAGVDAHAAALVDRVRRLPARVQYPYAAVRSLATYRPARYHVTVDGEAVEVLAATVVVANSAYYGQGMRIAPAADLADGLLDVVVIGAATRRSLVRSLPRVYDGSHASLPEVTVLRGTRVTLAADARTPVPVGGDGEPLGVLPGPDEEPWVVEVRPAALRVLAPPPPVAG